MALAPDRAVATDLGKRFVVVVGANNKAEYRPVEIGPLAGNLRIIRSGLKPGDRVIVGGLQMVKPGDKVNPVVVNGNNKAEYRPVEIGPLAGNLRIIRSGLKPGDRVIVGGLQKVKPGDTVNPVVVKTDLSSDLSQFESATQRVAMINSVAQN